MNSLGIWLIRPNAKILGKDLQTHLGGTLFCPWEQETSNLEQFQHTFLHYRKWVLVMTTGIATRYIQGLLESKLVDPAVVVLDEGARYAISFLSGHEGGANQLAYHVANVTGAIPVISTATESLKPLILGIGCRKGVSKEKIHFAIQQALQQTGRNLEEVRIIATIDLKGNEPGLVKWCAENNLPLQTIKKDLLSIRPWVTQSSGWVKKNIGVDGVCEPCALLASVRGELIFKKHAFDGVTVAIVDDPVYPDVTTRGENEYGK